jgi:hypothetical protein
MLGPLPDGPVKTHFHFHFSSGVGFQTSGSWTGTPCAPDAHDTMHKSYYDRIKGRSSDVQGEGLPRAEFKNDGAYFI